MKSVSTLIVANIYKKDKEDIIINDQTKGFSSISDDKISFK